MFIGFIVVLLLIAAGIGTAVAVGAAAVSKNNKKRNEVVPGITSPAPANWSGSHDPEAKLHRRVRDAVTGLHAIAGHDPAMAATIGKVNEEALAIDQQLVAVSLIAERFRAPTLETLTGAVEDLEEITAQAVGRSARTSELSVGDQLNDLSDRLEAMRLARVEVEEADRQGQTGQV